MSTSTRDVRALAVLLGVAGVGHLLRPQPFESMVPRQLPCARGLVYASGLAELACAAALARDDTRRLGGLATAALMAAVFPANLQMTVTALRSRRAGTAYTAYKVGTVARLPLQVPLVTTALKAARQGTARG